MLLRVLAIALLTFVTLRSAAEAALVEAVWSGTVKGATDVTQTLASDPATLVGQSVKFRSVYDTSVGRVSTPTFQGISGGVFLGPSIFRELSFTLGNRNLLTFGLGREERVSISFLGAMTEFSVTRSVSEGRFPPDAFSNSIAASILLRAQDAPTSLETPFTWKKSDGGQFSGAFSDFIFSFETGAVRRSVTLDLDWTSVSVSVVPGPASGLLLFTALVSPLIAARFKKRSLRQTRYQKAVTL